MRGVTAAYDDAPTSEDEPRASPATSTGMRRKQEVRMRASSPGSGPALVWEMEAEQAGRLPLV